MVIENRPGAGTIIATAAVAKAPADGHTMLMATNSLLINPAISQSLPYDTAKDFAAGQHGGDPAGRAGRHQIVPGRTIAGAGRRGEEDPSRSITPRRARAASAISPAKCSSSAPASR